MWIHLQPRFIKTSRRADNIRRPAIGFRGRFSSARCPPRKIAPLRVGGSIRRTSPTERRRVTVARFKPDDRRNKYRDRWESTDAAARASWPPGRTCSASGCCTRRFWGYTAACRPRCGPWATVTSATSSAGTRGARRARRSSSCTSGPWVEARRAAFEVRFARAAAIADSLLRRTTRCPSPSSWDWRARTRDSPSGDTWGRRTSRSCGMSKCANCTSWWSRRRESRTARRGRRSGRVPRPPGILSPWTVDGPPPPIDFPHRDRQCSSFDDPIVWLIVSRVAKSCVQNINNP